MFLNKRDSMSENEKKVYDTAWLYIGWILDGLVGARCKNKELLPIIVPRAVFCYFSDLSHAYNAAQLIGTGYHAVDDGVHAYKMTFKFRAFTITLITV